MASLIGARVARTEDPPLLRGERRYIDDIVVPGTLHAAFVRSPHPHAAIRSVGKDAALALPGVHAVLTLDDLASVMAQRRMMRHSNSGTPLDRMWCFALADGEVSYVGEPVAVVIADSRYIGEDAAALVDVDYDILPEVSDCRKAIEAGAPAVRRELNSNTVATYKVNFGDVDGAFAKAAHVFHTDLWQHRGAGHPIEGRGILAEYHRGTEGVTVWASTQKAHDMFQTITSLFDMDESRLRVVTPEIGGGFGPKLCIYSEDIAVVAASMLLKRSIKWIEDRREHFTNAAQERDQYWSVDIAVDADARILGIRGNLVHDVGAYALQDVNIPFNSASMMSGPYMIPALYMDVVVAATNKTPVSSIRGAGYPQAAFSMERLMDQIARELKLDRAELRRRHLIPAEKMPYTKPLKARSGAAMQYDSGDYPAAQAETLKAAGWHDFPKRQAEALTQGRHIGIGMAHGIKGTGRGPFESGVVKIANTGKVTVSTGAAHLGQGLRTVLAQITANELGLRPEDITVVSGDTSSTALGLGAFASRQMVTAGNSVLLASRAVAEKAKKLASHLLEAAEHDLELKDGAVHVVGSDRSVKLAELSRILKGAPGYGFPPGVDPGLEATAMHRMDALSYANACHVAEVEVDAETGAVHILNYVALQDSGVIINPMLVEGQMQGGIAHGIGNALYEWMGYDDAAQPVTTTFADYLLPTAMEIPRMTAIFKETPSPLNPLGAKGAGEVSTIPTAAAIVNAIEDALTPFNVRITGVPLTPQALVALIHGTGASGGH
jgi:carbon-monoxide dehydrogenase large subunit